MRKNNEGKAEYLARKWFDCSINKDESKGIAVISQIDFELVKETYGRLYEQMAKDSREEESIIGVKT